MRVAIVENTRFTNHGQVGVALHEAGAMIDIFKPWQDGKLPDPAQFDALVVFGGEQNARADDTHPYLPALATLMHDTALAGKATLGICLGAQIFARGAAAQNLIGTTPEYAWVAIEQTEAAKSDPLFATLPETFDSFEWHSDNFTAPDSAVILARTPTALQAFRIGRAGYGTQFHFEASCAVVANWAQNFGPFLESQLPGFLENRPALAATIGQRADTNGLALARAWVALI